MRIRSSIPGARPAAVITALGVGLFVAAGAAGQATAATVVTASAAHTAAHTTSAVSSACSRACLEGIAERYLTAMLSHDPSRAPLAHGARYTENGVTLSLPDGLWRTVGSVGTYRLFVTDPEQGEVGFFVKATENGAPVLVATRLEVVGGRITEIESIASRLAATAGPGGQPRVDQLGDHPRAQFLATLPANERHTRSQLIAIVNAYYTGIENNSGDQPPPFADDCLRLENGTQTTGLAVRPGAQPGPANYSCRQAFALGYYHEDTRIRSRRVMAIDVQRGLVYAAVGMDHDATVRSYHLKNGRPVSVRNTAPWTWMAHEIFQINGRGQISQVEAILLSVPYGMRLGWSTGVHMPSPQATRDGFREY